MAGVAGRGLEAGPVGSHGDPGHLHGVEPQHAQPASDPVGDLVGPRLETVVDDDDDRPPARVALLVRHRLGQRHRVASAAAGDEDDVTG